MTKEQKESLKFLIQTLLDVAPFHLVKGDFPQGNIAKKFRIENWRNNRILLPKMLNFVFVIKINNVFQIK